MRGRGEKALTLHQTAAGGIFEASLKNGKRDALAEASPRWARP